MDALRSYVLSVIGGALICGVVMNLAPGGKIRPILKYLCGLFLTVSLLQPLSDINLGDLFAQWQQTEEIPVSIITSQGQEYSHNLLSSRIKQEAEEYILDKATALGADITAELQLSDEDIPIPVGITVTGTLDQSLRNQLENAIEQDLGIAKENQRWIQTNSVKD